jgi:hypothetical protein
VTVAATVVADNGPISHHGTNEGDRPMNRKTDTNNTDTDTDTEGHMPFVRKVEDASENDTVTDTEGHGTRSGRIEEADTEGHGAVKKF